MAPADRLSYPDWKSRVFPEAGRAVRRLFQIASEPAYFGKNNSHKETPVLQEQRPGVHKGRAAVPDREYHPAEHNPVYSGHPAFYPDKNSVRICSAGLKECCSY